MKSRQCGYTLVEALIAAAILVIGIVGAAMFANSIVMNQEASALVSRAVNTQEQAARLYALGLSPTTITNILPEQTVAGTTPPPGSLAFSFTTNTNSFTGVGTMETAEIRVIFPVTRQTDGTITRRTNDVFVVRPSIR